MALSLLVSNTSKELKKGSAQQCISCAQMLKLSVSSSGASIPLGLWNSAFTAKGVQTYKPYQYRTHDKPDLPDMPDEQQRTKRLTPTTTRTAVKNAHKLTSS
jgi:hypothetical protein